MSYLKIWLILTAVFFWVNFFLDDFAPQKCSPGFISIGTPSRYACLSGHWLHDDPEYRH